jgi:DNA invertase Pin-like site-specific DNA recombinase
MSEPTTYDGYVRVSRVGGRSGDSYRSPSDQEGIIRRLAREKGLTIDEVPHEEDTSGKAPIEERALGRLIRKIEKGHSAGLIVYRVTRFSRDFVDGVMAAERVRAAGGRLIGEDIDTSMPGSRGYLAMLLDIAENELDNRRATWKRATDGAIERGLHLGKVPMGYVRPVVGRSDGGKATHGPLILDREHPERIEAVRYVFHQRALGATWGRIQADLEERFGLRLSRSSVYQLTSSRAFVGEVRSGDSVRKNAHPAIISEAEYQAAAAQAGDAPIRNGLIRGTGMLHGLVYCAGCGKQCYLNSTGKPGVGSYGCTNRRKERCPAPASMLVDRLDAYVLPGILDRIDTTWDAAAHAQREIESMTAMIDAEKELAAFLEHVSVAVLGEDYAPEVTRRREAVRAAIAEAAAVRRMAQEAGMVDLGDDQARPIDPRDPEEWNALPITKRREIAAMAVDHVTVSKAGRGSFGKQPMEERVRVEWRGSGRSRQAT